VTTNCERQRLKGFLFPGPPIVDKNSEESYRFEQYLEAFSLDQLGSREVVVLWRVKVGEHELETCGSKLTRVASSHKRRRVLVSSINIWQQP
jgi:hypothetical protein